MLKNQRGFTLIEMMIVLLVISVLLVITIPNVTKNNSTINEKGCKAFVKMVEGQVQAYEMENGHYPSSIDDLVEGEYLKADQTTCPNGYDITIAEDGTVTAGPPSP